MAENSVSDVDPDDLAEMMKGIDDLDDDLFGKKPKSALPPKETTPQRSVLKSSHQESSQGLKSGQQEGSQQGSGGRKVQFSPKTESDWDTNDVDPGEEKEKVTNQNEPFKDPPVRDIPRKKVEIDFGEDDILGGLDSNTSKSKSKPSSGLLDDIFGKPADKGKKSSFLDDIISGGASKEKPASSKSEFTLDDKYKVGKEKVGFDLGLGQEQPEPRRRRGNPTVGGKKASEPELLTSAKPKKTSESDIPTTNITSAPSTKPSEPANPFPWMTEKPGVPNSEGRNANQNQNETSRLSENVKPSFMENSNQKETQPTTIQFTPTLPHPHPTKSLVASSSKVGLDVGHQQQKVFKEEIIISFIIRIC